jgi:tetraacyldisaccharide 4'-kinase
MSTLLSAAYGAAAAWRRRWYLRHPLRRHRLSRPVISVGSLRVGGSGKTPVVGHLARILIESGERPAVLTRGYARQTARDGVTVVADGVAVRAHVDEAGDEPLMLAHAVPGMIVTVCADRHLAGLLAERLGATVHLLDDGFQHLALERDADLLLASEDDLTDAPLPSGRLREDVSAAASADAALVTAGYDTAAQRVARALGIDTAFRVTRSIAAPHMVAGEKASVVVPAGSRVFVVSGIARPERFTADIAAAGWHIAGAIAFRDHHRFTNADIRRIEREARAASSAIVLTTDKDAVRLAACELGDLPIASVPLTTGVEPDAQFREWLLERIAVARQRAMAPTASAQ